VSHSKPVGSARAAALVVVVASSCGGSPGDGESAPPVEALPRLAYAEEVRIGSFDDPAEGFSRIGSMTIADDGTLYVLESQAREVRVFAEDGSRLRTVGGPGEGPGEFGRPVSLGLVGDTLWVRDGAGGRVSWFGPGGSLLFETRGARLPVETDVPGMSLTVVTGDPRPDGFVGSSYSRVMAGGAADRPFSFPVVRFDREGVVVDTVRWDTVEIGPTVRVGGRALHPPSLRPTSPLVLEAGAERLEVHWSVAPSGPGTLRIVRIAESGDTLRRSALSYEPVPLPASVRDSLLDRPDGMGRLYGVSEAQLDAAMESGLELPDHRPPLRSGRTGVDGSLWIELNGESADSAVWVVLGEDLAPRGRMVLPLRTQPRVMNGPTVWAVETDELDVPWLVRLRVGPEGAPAPPTLQP